MVEMPTRTKVENWKSDHLASAADAWTRQAHTVEDIYGRAQQAVAEPTWHGSAADSAHDRMFSDIVRVRTAMEMLRKAAGIAKNGADLLAGLKRTAVEAISNAERQFFSVSDNLRVTDRMPKVLVGPLLLVRDLTRAAIEADIRGKALSLAAADEQIASQLKPIATSLREFKTDQPGNGAPAPGGAPKEPTITGPAGPLTPEPDKFDPNPTADGGKGNRGDLNVTLPGSDITISGDRRLGYPTIDGKRNPLDMPDDTRPLPTGTIVGPDGKQYALYSKVPYHLPNGDPNPNYATKDTTVVDLANPAKSIGVLPGISQASGAYDKTTNRMVIVGNTGPDRGDRTRMLWVSDPIDPANPDGWMNTLHPAGVIPGLPGDRENQLVALKGGGFMLLGSDNVVPNGNQQPMSAITAATPEGLLTAKPTALFPPGPQQNWPGGAPPYGPTVVDTTYDPVTGRETVDVRVSTWEAPKDWDPTKQKDMPYNPQTYRTSVTVQH